MSRQEVDEAIVAEYPLMRYYFKLVREQEETT